MEHNRPGGLGRGYYCLICGGSGLSMVGSSAHGPKICEPNPSLVRVLRYLNSALSEYNETAGMQALCKHDWAGYNGGDVEKDTKFQTFPFNGKAWKQCLDCGKKERVVEPELVKENEMAKYDQGGGCACGLQKECNCNIAESCVQQTIPGWDQRDALTQRGVERASDWGPKVGDGLSLGDKLAATIAALEGANLKRLEEQASADIAKIERERADIAHFVETLKNSMVDAIEAGRVPLVKVDNYERKKWIESAVKGTAPHQLYWSKMRDWFGQEALVIKVVPAHDGVGMSDWVNVTVTPSGVGKVNYRDGK